VEKHVAIVYTMNHGGEDRRSKKWPEGALGESYWTDKDPKCSSKE